ncbi:MAG: CoA protein activase [Desulfotomaculum sp.]|nr:CoA protein activase [Desulfotomaculum sp.]
MRKVTFPHMGHSCIPFKMLMEELGNEVIMPPVPTKKTLDLGVKYSPEFVCLPYKIVLGTYLEAIELGADTLIAVDSYGPCRFGHYSHLHQSILQDMGHEAEVICFGYPKRNYLDFIRKLHRVTTAKTPLTSIYLFYKAFKKSWEKLKALDAMEKLSHQIRPRELKRGDTSKVYRQTQAWLDEAKTYEQIAEAKVAGIKAFKNIAIDPQRQVLKVGLTGEIYVLLEPTSNLEIEETLGYMGVEVERSLYLTGWTQDTLGQSTKEHDTAIEAAKPYLPYKIGGHGRETVGHVVKYARRQFDGVVQVAPFTCTPEIVARTILNKVSNVHDIPVLTFFFDEQTGKAGMTTRLEAFIDLLKRKQQSVITAAAI